MNNEGGQATVIVALLLVILLGSAALAVDIGSEVAHGIRLQGAASAAALAGAAELGAGGDSGQVTAQVDDYLTANQVPTDAARINIDGGTVQVSLGDRHSFRLAKVFGFLSQTVYRSATAAQTPPGVFGYALFAGDHSNPSGTVAALNLDANQVSVTGNVHSNADVDVVIDDQSDQSTISGRTEAVGAVNAPDVQTTAFPGSPSLNMPDLSGQVYLQAQKANQVIDATGDPGETYVIGNGGGCGGNNVTINGTLYVIGNVDIETNNLKGGGAIFATGYIDVSAENISSGADNIAFYSENSNINLLANTITANGIFYAPDGTIDAWENHSGGCGCCDCPCCGGGNGNKIDVTGCLVAKDIDLENNQVKVTWSNAAASSLPGIATLTS